MVYLLSFNQLVPLPIGISGFVPTLPFIRWSQTHTGAR